MIVFLLKYISDVSRAPPLFVCSQLNKQFSSSFCGIQPALFISTMTYVFLCSEEQYLGVTRALTYVYTYLRPVVNFTILKMFEYELKCSEMELVLARKFFPNNLSNDMF